MVKEMYTNVVLMAVTSVVFPLFLHQRLLNRESEALANQDQKEKKVRSVLLEEKDLLEIVENQDRRVRQERKVIRERLDQQDHKVHQDQSLTSQTPLLDPIHY